MSCWSLMKRAGVLTLALLAAVPANAQIKQEELNAFVKETRGDYSGMGEEFNLLSVFHLAARLGKTPDGTIALYSEVRGITERQALSETRLLLDVWRHMDLCTGGPTSPPCAFTKHPDLAARIRRVGMGDKTGFMFLTLGESFGVTRWFGRNDRAAFLNMIKGHPALDVICLGLTRYNGEHEFLVPLLASGVSNTQAIGVWVESANNADTGRSLALMDRIRRRIASGELGSGAHAFVTIMMIAKLLSSGQTDEAIRFYDTYPDQGQLWDISIVPELNWRKVNLARVFERLYARLPGEEPSEFQLGGKTNDQRSRAVFADGITHTKISIAAALLHNDRRDEARALLDGLSMAELQRLGLNGRQKLYFLREIMNPLIAHNLVYDIFTRNGGSRVRVGSLAERIVDNLPPVIGEIHGLFSGRIQGWLWITRSPPFDELGFDYLIKAGYDELARYLLSGKLYREPYDELVVYDIYADRLGTEFFERAARYKTQITAIDAERKERIRASRKNMVRTPIHVGERPVLFVEHPLPKSIAPFSSLKGREVDSAKDEAKSAPQDLQLPVSPYQVARLERTGKEWTLVFLSHALDPVGEVSRGGYWITRSRARGHDWETPIYLGLQQFFPYVVTPKSNLPLMDGNTLQIEVQVRELDTESITFPPIDLRAKRRKGGLFLTFEWEKLTHDSDSDGLTDLVEHRMGLDPQNPDTDEDGLFDGSDSLPLTSFRLRKPKENELAIAILKQILGYEREAIIVGNAAPRSEDSFEDILKSARGPRPAIDPMHTTFMMANPGIFAGIRLPRRLLVYGPDAIEQIRKRYGVFYPVDVQWVLSNKSGTQHHVFWNARWAGGEFVLRKKADGYIVIRESRWVT